MAMRLLLTTIPIAAFTYGRISRIIRHRVTHSSISRLTMKCSTPNEKTVSEVAKQALSDYIATIRLKMLSLCTHHPELAVIDNNTCITVSVSSGDQWKGLIWDRCIYKYSVNIDTSDYMDVRIGFALSKLFDVSKDNFDLCGWYGIYTYKMVVYILEMI
jgi:hypothetical protein